MGGSTADCVEMTETENKTENGDAMEIGKTERRQMEFYEDEDDVPCLKCGQYNPSNYPCRGYWRSICTLFLQCSFLLPTVCFFVVMPIVMIYIGIAYSYCEDMFSVWLIAGG